MTQAAKSKSRKSSGLAELQDREAIRTLVHRMNWLSDGGQLDELLDCFVDDLCYEVGSFGTFHSKPELRSFYESVFAAYTMRMHHTTNQLIELDNSRAIARSYWRAELVYNGRAVVSSGHYVDELLKDNAGWKVRKRNASLTYMCPLDEGWAKTRMMQLE